MLYILNSRQQTAAFSANYALLGLVVFVVHGAVITQKSII